jgi:NAD+ diphosphatase
MTTLLQRAYPPSRPEPGQAYWLLFQSGEFLVQENEATLVPLQGNEMELAALLGQTPLYLGVLNGVACLAGEVSAEWPLPAGWRRQELRGLFGLLDERIYGMAGYAWQILCWRRESSYCPRCGRPLGELSTQWARHCTNCCYIGYPPVTPAIMVLVHDGTRILLARNVGWKQRYSVIAGFVEPGESLEDCVRREVAEEVGLSVTDITYAGSQSWPFPHQLMIGFTASYAGGQLCLDPNEIADAAWFTPASLPDVLPGTVSLARQLIDSWLHTHKDI